MSLRFRYSIGIFTFVILSPLMGASHTFVQKLAIVLPPSTASQRANAVSSRILNARIHQQPIILQDGPPRAVAGVTFTRLYRFSGPDGKYPTVGLLPYNNELYSTASGGGSFSCFLDKLFDYGCGTFFKISPLGKLTKLRDFDHNPVNRLIRDVNGNIFGTTYDRRRIAKSRYGTIFKQAPNGVFTTVYTLHFPGTGGVVLISPLVLFGKGYLYGITISQSRQKKLFRVSPQGRFSIVSNSLEFPSDDAFLGDGSGNFYGATTRGGTKASGTIFKVTSSGAFTTLYEFQNSPEDGQFPNHLVRDASGNFYGSAAFGIPSKQRIFKLDADGTFSILHQFDDSVSPVSSLILDRAGNLYGATRDGGVNDKGTIFQIATDGTFSTLYEFGGKGSGVGPTGLSLFGGELWGVTTLGGAVATAPQGKCRSEGCGTIFKLTISPSAPLRQKSTEPMLETPLDQYQLN